MSLAEPLSLEIPTPPRRDARTAPATLAVWVDRVPAHGTLQGLLGLVPPALVLTCPEAGTERRRVDLGAIGRAHRVTAVAFTPGPGCASVTLREAVDTSPSSRVAELLVSGPGFLDLYTVGWAARTAEVVFNP